MNKFDPNTKNEILKQIKALGFVYQQNGKWFKTDYAGDKDVDEKINKFVESMASKLQEVERAAYEKVNNVLLEGEDTEETIKRFIRVKQYLVRELAQLKGETK